MSNVILGANGMKYRVVHNGGNSWVVVELRAQRDKTVFEGTRTECDEWIERNGFDEWN